MASTENLLLREPVEIRAMRGPITRSSWRWAPRPQPHTGPCPTPRRPWAQVGTVTICQPGYSSIRPLCSQATRHSGHSHLSSRPGPRRGRGLTGSALGVLACPCPGRLQASSGAQGHLQHLRPPGILRATLQSAALAAYITSVASADKTSVAVYISSQESCNISCSI